MNSFFNSDSKAGKSSYGVTVRIVKASWQHRQNPQSFRSAEGHAQETSSEFGQAGIGKPSIWDDLQAQGLFRVGGFIEGLRHLVTEKQQIRERTQASKNRRRPSLKKLFSHRSPGKGSGSSPKPSQRTVIAKWKWETSCALYSTIIRILAADKSAKSKYLIIPLEISSRGANRHGLC